MSNSTNDLTGTIDTYLEAYGEPDADRRLELIQKVWANEGRLVDPPLEAAGHTGISDMAAAVQGQFPAHRFTRTSGIDAHHGFARYSWQLAAADGTVALVGTDFVEVDDDGRLTRVVGFLGDLPA